MSNTTPPADDRDDTDDRTVTDDQLDQLGLSAVPETLRNRDNQWVCWTTQTRTDANGDPYETKVPVKPWNAPNAPNAKPNDPDTWGDFAQAVEYHADPTTDTAGIGFMFADNGVIAGADLDDVTHPDVDAIEPWAEDVIDRLDSYTERSPSGTGYHILFLGTLPDGKSKSGVDREVDALADRLDDPDDPNMGPDIELYDSGRFFTVTGDHVEGTPTTLEQRNSVVDDVHADYVADDEDDDANGDVTEWTEPDVDVTLDDEQLIERATDAKNGDLFARLYRGDTSGYPSQSEADMAFAQLLAFWTQRDRQQMDRIFQNSGLMRPKWNEEHFADGSTYGEKTIERACRRADTVYDPSPNRQEEVEVPDPADPDPADGTDTDDGDGGGDGDGDGDPRAAEARAVAGEADDGDAPATAADGSGDGGGGGPPGDGDGGDGDDDDDDGIPKPGFEFSFTVRDGGYGRVETDESGEVTGFDRWTNFEIEVNSFLHVEDHEDDRKFDLTIHPSRAEAPFDVAVSPDAFADPRSFREKVACGFSTTFDGGREAVNRIKEFVSTQAAHMATGTPYMGRHGDEFVFPNGTLTADGWADDPDYIYVSRGEEGSGDSLGEMCELGPEMGADFDAHEAGRVAELLPQLHDPERFYPVLGWFYATPFRPFIYEWTGQFNFLSITGDTGSGKTRTTGLVNKAFGMGTTPLSVADTTSYSVMMTLASANAVPVWYDEWKPSDLSEHMVNDITASIRQTTTEGTPQRGNADGGVQSLTMKAPLAIGGEERVRGSAEERRGIFTTYPKGVTRADSEYRPVYEELNGDVDAAGRDLSEHALAYYTFALELSKADIKSLWSAAKNAVAKFCDRNGITELEDLEEQGLVTVRFGLMLHERFCNWLGTADNPVTEREITDTLHYLGTESAGGSNRQSHVDEYLKLMAEAAMNDYVERDTHYTFTYTDDDETPTALRFTPSIHAQVSKYVQDHDATADLLNRADDYRERFRDQLQGDGDTYVEAVGKQTWPMNIKCDGVEVEAAEQAIPGFDRAMFDADDITDDVRSSDPALNDATRVRDLDASQTYTTVTVTPVSVDRPDSDGIALTATVRDDTGVVDLVQWSGVPIDIEEGTEYHLRSVKVTTDADDALQLVAVDGATLAEPVDTTDTDTDTDEDDPDDDGEDGDGEAGTDDGEDGGGDGGDGGPAAASTPGTGDEPAAEPSVDPDEYDDVRADIARVVQAEAPIESGALIGKVSSQTDKAPAAVEDAIGRLREAGRLTELPDGRLV